MTTQPLCALQREAAIIGSPITVIPPCSAEERRHWRQALWQNAKGTGTQDSTLGARRWLCQPLIYTLPNGRAHRLGVWNTQLFPSLREVADSRERAEVLEFLICVPAFWGSPPKPATVSGFHLQKCRNEKTHKKDGRKGSEHTSFGFGGLGSKPEASPIVFSCQTELPDLCSNLTLPLDIRSWIGWLTIVSCK